METRVILIPFVFSIFFLANQYNQLSCLYIKELTNKNGYGPVTVNMLVIGEKALYFKKKKLYTQALS